MSRNQRYITISILVLLIVGLQVNESLAENIINKPMMVKGVVFEDENGNGLCDKNEDGIANVAVSNGNEVVLTDKEGCYQLDIDGDTIVFLIKPSGWMTKVNEFNLPYFYYIHSPKGSPKLKYGGIDPTGPLPKSIDFPLYKNKEPEKFDVVIFGDPQVPDMKSLNYFYHDAIEEVMGIKAAFGVTLGDIAFDDLSVFMGINEAVSLIGLPWYNLPGNHDMDFDADSDEKSLETYKRIYGPAYYSFNYGNVHFVVLDNIIAKKTDKSRLSYNEGLSDQQLEFVKNDLAYVDKNKLIVVLGHAYISQFNKNKNEFLNLLEKFPYTLSIAGHRHTTENLFLKLDDGWNGEQPHHMYISGAVCGAWWYGFPSDEGIPHAMMPNGVPNGYSVITFDKNKYSIRFKAFGKSQDCQMHAFMPDEIPLEQVGQTEVLLNVFAGSEKSIVEMKVGSERNWHVMERKVCRDPYYGLAVAEEKKYNFKRGLWKTCQFGFESEHIWRAILPNNLGKGTHVLYFRSTDMYGQSYNSKRVFRVK